MKKAIQLEREQAMSEHQAMSKKPSSSSSSSSSSLHVSAAGEREGVEGEGRVEKGETNNYKTGAGKDDKDDDDDNLDNTNVASQEQVVEEEEDDNEVQEFRLSP